MSARDSKRVSWKRISWIFGGLLLAGVFFGWLVLVSVWGGQRLGPQRDFIKELNARIDSIPSERRAWPRLRAAVDELELDRSRSFDEQVDELARSSDPLVQDRWVSANQTGLASLRSAAARPEFGFAWGMELPAAPDRFLLLTPEERATLPSDAPEDGVASDQNEYLLALQLRFLQPMRSMARLLEVDARSAARTGDAKRAVDDCIAMLDLARIVQQDPMMISQLVGLAIRSLAQRTILDLVRTDALGSDPQQLARLEQALSVPVVPVAFEGERMIVLDTVQRFYSDDGNGDGVFLASQLQEAGRLGGLQMPASGARAFQLLLQPFMARAAGSRKQVIDTFEGLVTETQMLMDTDPWAIDWAGLDSRQGALVSDGFLGVIHLFPLPLVMSSFDGIILTSQSGRFMQDCTRLVVALHRYRARTGDWPARLDQLQPDPLVELPRDPYDGDLLRYELRDGQPVLWSIGIDGIDQGGVFKKNASPFRLQRVPVQPASPPLAFDERLWPPPVPVDLD